MTEPHYYKPPGLTNPASRAVAVTPSDSVDLVAASRGIWVGTGGNLAVITAGGDTVTVPNVQDGTLVPIRASRVLATGTTATGLVAMW